MLSTRTFGIRLQRRDRECQQRLNPRCRLHTIAAVAAAICCGATAHAQETGQVPYATIHKAVTRAQQVKHPKVRAFVIVQSKTKPDKPVTMAIKAKSGPINVDISKDGEIRNFPVSADLLKENPPVLSNQPKGSSALVVGLELVVPDTLTYSYRELAQQLEDANAEVKKQAGVLSLVAPRAKAVVFQFRARGKATVTVSRKEPQVLTADPDGRVRLEIDKSIAAQDPQVVVSEKPIRVLVN